MFLLKDATSIQYFVDSLRQLKKLEDTLTTFLGDLHSHIEETTERHRSQILEHGISSLPDTVLMLIFELGRETGYKYQGWMEPVRLSHVNKRFRRIALATPRLWSTLSNSQSAAVRQVLLQRSKAVDLTFYINDPSLPPSRSRQHFTEFLEFLLPLTPRCGRFEYFQEGYHDAEDDFKNAELRRILAGVSFPKLTYLFVGSWGLDRLVRSEKYLDFYRTWHTPSLRHVSAYNTLPCSTSPVDVVSCDIEIVNHDELDDSELEPLDLVLFSQAIGGGQLPSMQSLFLSLDSVTFQHVDLSVQHVTLPSLAVLKLVYNSLSMPAPMELLSLLMFPMLDQLEVEFPTWVEEDPPSLLEACIPKAKSCPRLHNVTICIDGSTRSHSHILGTLMMCLPQVLHLDVSLPYDRFNGDNPTYTPKVIDTNLRTLKVSLNMYLDYFECVHVKLHPVLDCRKQQLEELAVSLTCIARNWDGQCTELYDHARVVEITSRLLR